ncbi:MAG: tetratricopeptide repeat protein [Acidobacteria bacterium]|nr:MAG: tetratricopeptide repeat protein [Acidobacteriota bacterium]
MNNIARWFVAGMVVLSVSLPSGAGQGADRTAEPIGSFSEMVARSADKFDDPKLKFSCTEVDVSLLMGEKEKPELERLLVDLALAPGDQGRHVRLGNYYARHNLWHHAAAAFGCANGIDDTVALVWNNLGIVYLGLDNPSGAVTVLRKAIKLDRDYGLAFYNLGLAYDELEKYDAALNAYERAITLDPKLATVAHNPAVASNRHQVSLFLRRLAKNPIALAASLDE